MVDRRFLLVLWSFLLVGCGDDDASKDAGSGVDGQSTVDAQVDAVVDSGTADADASEPEWMLATGVRITDVEFNQGVGVALVADGTPIAQSARVAPLVAGRPALVRVLWAVDAPFTARELIGRLTLSRQNGDSERFETTRLVTGDAGWGSVDDAFSFELGAADLRPGDRLDVGIFDAAAATPGDPTHARYPASGSVDLALPDEAMHLEVVVLPANEPTIDANLYSLPQDLRDMIETELFNLFPVHSLSVTYHSPVTLTDCWDGPATMAQISQLRDDEGAAAHVYYHAIFNDQHNGICLGGYSWLLDDVDTTDDRVSMSVNHPGEIPNNVGHELGHSHGRDHTWEDSSYQPGDWPNPDCGRRATWGWPVRSGKHPQADNWWDFPAMATLDGWLIAPTEGLGLDGVCHGHADYAAWGPALNDVMSYAYPYWVSAYTYAALAERVRAVSAFPTPLRDADRPFRLHAARKLDGSLLWYRVRTREARTHGPANPPVGETVAHVYTSSGVRRVPVLPKRDGDGLVAGFALGTALLEPVKRVVFDWQGRRYDSRVAVAAP